MWWNLSSRSSSGWGESGLTHWTCCGNSVCWFYSLKVHSLQFMWWNLSNRSSSGFGKIRPHSLNCCGYSLFWFYSLKVHSLQDMWCNLSNRSSSGLGKIRPHSLNLLWLFLVMILQPQGTSIQPQIQQVFFGTRESPASFTKLAFS